MRKNIVFLVLGILLFAGIYAWRLKHLAVCPAICKYEDQTAELNHASFLEIVVPALKTHRRFNLVVFVDPDRECQACMYETEYWLAPEGDEPEFATHFFIPSTKLEEMVREEKIRVFVDTFNISPEHLIRYDTQGPLAEFHRHGVTKIFYEPESGVRWFEFGNPDEEAQKRFYQRVLDTIASSTSSSGAGATR